MHRLDAWLGSVAAWRLEGKRGARAQGIQVGAYGWLEDVQPRRQRDSQGYVVAPSAAHATTAAVLRSGWSAFGGDAESAGLAVDLSSDRLRRARWLIDGVRNGQDLGQLLGARFERRLHDDGARRPDRGRCARSRSTAAGISAAPTAIVDGLLLARGRGYLDAPGDGFTDAERDAAGGLDDLLKDTATPKASATGSPTRSTARSTISTRSPTPRRPRASSRSSRATCPRRRRRCRPRRPARRRSRAYASPTRARRRRRSRTGCCCSSTRARRAPGRARRRAGGRSRRPASRRGSTVCSATPSATRCARTSSIPRPAATLTAPVSRTLADAGLSALDVVFLAPAGEETGLGRLGDVLAAWADGLRPKDLDPAPRPCSRSPSAIRRSTTSRSPPARCARCSPRHATSTAATSPRRAQPRPRAGWTRAISPGARTPCAPRCGRARPARRGRRPARDRDARRWRASSFPAAFRRRHRTLAAQATALLSADRRSAGRLRRARGRRARLAGAPTALGDAPASATSCRSRLASPRPTAPRSTRRSRARGSARRRRRPSGWPRPAASTRAPAGCAWRSTSPRRVAAGRSSASRSPSCPTIPTEPWAAVTRPDGDEHARLCLLSDRRPTELRHRRRPPGSCSARGPRRSRAGSATPLWRSTSTRRRRGRRRRSCSASRPPTTRFNFELVRDSSRRRSTSRSCAWSARRRSLDLGQYLPATYLDGRDPGRGGGMDLAAPRGDDDRRDARRGAGGAHRRPDVAARPAVAGRRVHRRRRRQPAVRRGARRARADHAPAPRPAVREDGPVIARERARPAARDGGRARGRPLRPRRRATRRGGGLRAAPRAARARGAGDRHRRGAGGVPARRRAGRRPRPGRPRRARAARPARPRCARRVRRPRTRRAVDGRRRRDPDAAAQDAIAAWAGWYAELVQRAGRVRQPWDPQRMEYRFQVAAGVGRDAEVQLDATEYVGGHLDWYSFDRAGKDAPDLGARGALERHTCACSRSPARFSGQAASRWWQVEDGEVWFGDIGTAPEDLARVAVAGFGMAFGDNWYLVPCRLPGGVIARATRGDGARHVRRGAPDPLVRRARRPRPALALLRAHRRRVGRRGGDRRARLPVAPALARARGRDAERADRGGGVPARRGRQPRLGGRAARGERGGAHDRPRGARPRGDAAAGPAGRGRVALPARHAGARPPDPARAGLQGRRALPPARAGGVVGHRAPSARCSSPARRC